MVVREAGTSTRLEVGREAGGLGSGIGTGT
jgi:hypothetical protein